MCIGYYLDWLYDAVYMSCEGWCNSLVVPRLLTRRQSRTAEGNLKV